MASFTFYATWAAIAATMLWLAWNWRRHGRQHWPLRVVLIGSIPLWIVIAAGFYMHYGLHEAFPAWWGIVTVAAAAFPLVARRLIMRL